MIKETSMKLVEIIDVGDLRIFSTGISTSYDFFFYKIENYASTITVQTVNIE